jgi:hypothetical protein
MSSVLNGSSTKWLYDGEAIVNKIQISRVLKKENIISSFLKQMEFLS